MLLERGILEKFGDNEKGKGGLKSILGRKRRLSEKRPKSKNHYKKNAKGDPGR